MSERGGSPRPGGRGGAHGADGGHRVAVAGDRRLDTRERRRRRPTHDRRATGAPARPRPPRRPLIPDSDPPRGAVRRRGARSRPSPERGRRRRWRPTRGIPDRATRGRSMVVPRTARPALIGSSFPTSVSQGDGSASVERGQHEHQAEERGDRGCSTPEQGAETDAEESDHGEVGAGAHDRAQHARFRDRDVCVLGRQDALPDEEGDEARDRGDDERDDGEGHRLREQHQRAARNGREGRSNHPGRVLGADHQHAEHSDRQLGEEHTPQADRRRVEGQALSDGEVAPPTHAGGRDDRTDPHDGDDRHDERPNGRSHRAKLGGFGRQRGATAPPAGARSWRG